MGKSGGWTKTQLEKDHEHVMQALPSPEERGILLALAHCYYSRLEKPELRLGYRQMIAKVMTAGGARHKYEELRGSSTFEKLLMTEQQDILNRMDFSVHPNIAHNGALMENVFISFVCIRIKLPVFIVGKPGNSKSLAMQLLNSSLRGPDSKDPLFKRMPGVNFVSFQGSEDSTSEGIKTVFEKAEKYLTDTKKQKDAPEVIPVVLLDEVGLAEISRHNPLKVLHALLEPAFGETAKVAVVGISNWALDAAKMNRAIHLSRPDPDADDLIMTGQKILESFADDERDIEFLSRKMRDIASNYARYYKGQRIENFHGLRDFCEFDTTNGIVLHCALTDSRTMSCCVQIL
eukprot:COSAG06_NODE_5702_length_3313_cov_2.543559_2_plen_347_part_00